MSDLTPGESYLYLDPAEVERRSRAVLRTPEATEAALPTIRITPKGLAALHKRLGGVEPLSPVGAVA